MQVGRWGSSLGDVWAQPAPRAAVMLGAKKLLLTPLPEQDCQRLVYFSSHPGSACADELVPQVCKF